MCTIRVTDDWQKGRNTTWEIILGQDFVALDVDRAAKKSCPMAGLILVVLKFLTLQTDRKLVTSLISDLHIAHTVIQWFAHSTDKILRFMKRTKLRCRVHVGHESPSEARSIFSTRPLPIPLRNILMTSSDLYVRLPSGLLSSDFPTKILHAFFYPPTRAMCTARLAFLHLTVNFFDDI
jgi:hypothetical protein